MDSRALHRLPAILSLAAMVAPVATAAFFQTNLTSDIQGLAPNSDPSLKNPWGMSFGLNTPFWISDQVTDISTLYYAV